MSIDDKHPTMGALITEDNYPIVAAILGTKYARYPMEKLIGNYVVINEVLYVRDADFNGIHITLQNVLYKKRDFERRYSFLSNGSIGSFGIVGKNEETEEEPKQENRTVVSSSMYDLDYEETDEDKNDF